MGEEILVQCLLWMEGGMKKQPGSNKTSFSDALKEMQNVQEHFPPYNTDLTRKWGKMIPAQ